MKTPRAAAIYARMSKDVTGQGMGIDRQVEDCQGYARQLGWPVAHVYSDNDVSAYSGRIRPAYRQLLADLRAGAVDAVIVYRSDRLHRSPLELEEYIQVVEAAGADTKTVASGLFDLSTADGRYIARMHGAAARAESEKMGERMRRANRQRAEQGKPATKGLRCFGYERDGITIIPSEAAIIRDLAERFLAGESLSALVRWLNDNEIPTVQGHGRWYSSVLRGLLRRPRLSGQCEYQGKILAPGQWEPIITAQQTAAIRRILDDPARKRERAPSRYLLTKLVRCGLCMKPLISHPRRDKPGYACRKDALGGCGRISINAEPLDEYVRDSVLLALDGPELAAALTDRDHPRRDAATLADDIRADEAHLLDLAASYANREMNRDQFAAANRIVTERLTTNRERLANVNGQTDLARYLGQGTDLRERWHTMTLDQRRAVIRSVISTVTITPATKALPFDPDRAELAWRV